MSDTHHRKHLSRGDRSKRGGRMDPELRNERERPLKTPKQKRPGEKARLRKEFL